MINKEMKNTYIGIVIGLLAGSFSAISTYLFINNFTASPIATISIYLLLWIIIGGLVGALVDMVIHKTNNK